VSPKPWESPEILLRAAFRGDPAAITSVNSGHARMPEEHGANAPAGYGHVFPRWELQSNFRCCGVTRIEKAASEEKTPLGSKRP
jgi:hypothetical protein